ncbi:hypothetical protein GCM10023084_02800 [Streptomyces lacrimifluminis]|uniref:NUDIX hydrolase n=1 Tax=Streptomyces lacrimifluminis TaxID=1500077 RepID=UPI0031EDBD45
MTEQTARIINQAADSIEANVRCQTHTEANGKANAVDHLRQLAAEAQSATGNPSVVTDRVLSEVLAERIRQDDRFGEQNHPDGTGGVQSRQLRDEAQKTCQAAAERGIVTWLHIADEEHCEALAESDPVRLRAELVQGAAVYVAWIEAIDRRTA